MSDSARPRAKAKITAPASATCRGLSPAGRRLFPTIRWAAMFTTRTATESPVKVNEEPKIAGDKAPVGTWRESAGGDARHHQPAGLARKSRRGTPAAARPDPAARASALWPQPSDESPSSTLYWGLTRVFSPLRGRPRCYGLVCAQGCTASMCPSSKGGSSASSGDKYGYPVPSGWRGAFVEGEWIGICQSNGVKASPETQSSRRPRRPCAPLASPPDPQKREGACGAPASQDLRAVSGLERRQRQSL